MLAIILSCLALGQWATPINKETEQTVMKRALWLVDASWLKLRRSKKITKPCSCTGQKSAAQKITSFVKICAKFAKWPVKVLWYYIRRLLYSAKNRKIIVERSVKRANSCKLAWSSRKPGHYFEETKPVLCKKVELIADLYQKVISQRERR